MKPNVKNKKAAKQSNVKKSRKEIRKAKRNEKKQHRVIFQTRRTKLDAAHAASTKDHQTKPTRNTLVKHTKNSDPDIITKSSSLVLKEKKIEKQLKDKMAKQRKRQLIEANKIEDKNIKRLEKQLKLTKRKSKAIPKTFVADGLDYLLELCDSDNLKDVISTEMDIQNDTDFDEDINMMTHASTKKSKFVESDHDSTSNQSNSDMDDWNEDEDEDLQSSGSPDEEADEESMGEESQSEAEQDPETPVQTSTTWQDIYGRTRDHDGNVVNEEEKQSASEGKYIPPAQRQRMESNVERLRRQLKGLLNRLAERNMHSISNQIEALYMSHSRNDMNESLNSLIFDALITRTACPERLLLEHVLLISVLHANVGSDVGAQFLQAAVKRFDTLFTSEASVEEKTLDNIVALVSQLYNFQICKVSLMHEILAKLSNEFTEKHIECILNVLRHVGCTMRKDDPQAFKNLIINLQRKATEMTATEDPRVKYMLDVLVAIKNNNLNKIPNFNISHSEHLKKNAKSLIRKGCYVTPMNIGLDDLLKADERGRWWIVGSAWTGKSENKPDEEISMKPTSQNQFSQKLLDLAKKQRMNTDTRRTIFCIILSAEDYMDAFEKLLHLNLTHQQEREIMSVLMHCCLSEKQYNPYYAVLAQKFCDHDRKYQLIIKCAIWDKLHALADCTSQQFANLAKLLTHLLVEKGLPISMLKVVEWGELDKVTLRFMRQVLIGILLTSDSEKCEQVFARVGQLEKLKMFRESLRLFIHHFLLRNLKSDSEQKDLLKQRAAVVDKLLSSERK